MCMLFEETRVSRMHPIIYNMFPWILIGALTLSQSHRTIKLKNRSTGHLEGERLFFTVLLMVREAFKFTDGKEIGVRNLTHI